MWFGRIILGLILFWLGIRILRSSRPKIRQSAFDKQPPVMEAIALERQKALDKAQNLIAQLEIMQSQQKARLTGLDTAVELNAQVALDAVQQYERAKALIEELLRRSNFSQRQIDEIIAGIEVGR